ncbi:MraY family glycosyltransferase [Acetobacter oeni]|uniref:Undecaprenyl-phosphate alpha-N-acetylglucosaminyl 1-phosphate transferase n=1 Tax=Acetobacter oeni TaxID=304077 RepID=A0A511XG61_9PROT|nr:UDP-phosphate alpha-N-acetylglucosaminephosphotransferase [Acetobacter oeni]MBB3882130.1 UDP-N-acetylmuramyl pentapeptide phosphotransferase/UDP-N-acetylglucosamine-1-phosphate transferase [Acetobacter oeni]NHO17893.1 UDP-phosphate alpha-N-acetylglucosaminephosphotransferase [Acetobacter oeni]GBR08759.1 undecaprenyl-phosphate alpha-N-acetylglucosaminephosphotransferase [Acetobacter oeni LMG 21952]GEN61947.1 undecaprenyl-phosphate alpha-N-acetylglucosaminyl 1-phosphate transferase [Acetobacte
MFHDCLPLILLIAAYGTASLLIRRMIAIAVLDTPGHRSAHTSPTPKGGGIGVIGAFLLFFIPLRTACDLPPLTIEAGGLWIAVALLAVVSWLDDVYQWPPLIKLTTQLFAAIIVTLTMLPVDAFSSPLILCGAVVASIIWLVFVTNAVNFMDGLNGLVAGSLCLTFLCLTLPGWPADSLDTRLVAALIAFGLLAFLPYNFPHARIFLGDVGSQSCGLLTGTAALSFMTNGSHEMLSSLDSALLVPCLIAGLLYDVTITLIRRAIVGEKILQAHRGHLYQVACRSGVPMPVVSLIHWGFVIWGGCVFALVGHTITAASGITIIFALIALPQLAWTIFVLLRIRQHPVGRW